MKKNTIFYTFILLTISLSSKAETIADREFKEVNSPIFKMAGFVNFSASSSNQSNSFEKNKLPDAFSENNINNKNAAGNDTQIFFKSAIKTTNGDKYGAVAKVEFNINSNHYNQKPNLDQAHLFSENSFGKFEFGNYFAANQKMKVGPARFARGAGGINGKYLEYVNLPMLANSSQSSSSICSGNASSTACSNVKLPRFILLAQSPVGHGGDAKSFYSSNYSTNASSYSTFNHSNFRAIKDDSFDGVEDATKITYYLPRIEGFQIGASFAPNSNNSGLTKTSIYNSNQVRMENIISFGANYSHDFDNLNLAISATAEKSQVKNSKSNYGVERYDLLSYDLGFSLSYFGFDVGASYGSWGSSIAAKNGIYSCNYNSAQNLSAQNCLNSGERFSNPYYYTLGIAYKIGPIGASISSIESSFQENKYQAISLGLDYKLRRDLMPYFEVTKFNFKSNQALAFDIANQSSIVESQRQIRDNKGYVFLTGILYIF